MVRDYPVQLLLRMFNESLDFRQIHYCLPDFPVTYGFDPIVSFMIVVLIHLVFTINTSTIFCCVKQNIIGYKYLVKYCKFSNFITNRVYLLHMSITDAVWAYNRFIYKVGVFIKTWVTSVSLKIYFHKTRYHRSPLGILRW